MDAFEEPFWNLDQLRAWALTRDPDLVRVAALPRVDVQQINSGLIAFRILHAATKLKADGPRCRRRTLAGERNGPAEEALFFAPRTISQRERFRNWGQ